MQSYGNDVVTSPADCDVTGSALPARVANTMVTAINIGKEIILINGIFTNKLLKIRRKLNYRFVEFSRRRYACTF